MTSHVSMEEKQTRRSDRVHLELAFQVSGTDSMGRVFMDETRTVVLSRHGAKILLNRSLVPDQELDIRCRSTGKESAARVVGKIGEGPEGFHYGVEFMEPEADVWGIKFPPLAECEIAVARILLECMHCHARELAYLDEFELEVFEANWCLSRRCKRCGDSSIWRQLLTQPPSEQSLPPEPKAGSEATAAQPIRTQNERKEVRISLRITASVRHPQLGEEVVTTENVSRGGFAFKSRRHYTRDLPIEVAIPYSEGGGNIFVPAQIEHIEHLAAKGLTLYGISFIRAHKGWPAQ